MWTSANATIVISDGSTETHVINPGDTWNSGTDASNSTHGTTRALRPGEYDVAACISTIE